MTDTAVIGLPHRERGELVRAVAEQPPGARELNLPEAAAYLRGQGPAPHKLPERPEAVEALPRGATPGKVLMGELRGRFGGGSGAVRGRCGQPQRVGRRPSYRPRTVVP
ncbi:hypothetical protein [Streptomyces natalensis]|uniref:AMP-binding enzyme C-terminal domain-containing protein n=1 Tax=Streptomyces natalensis ATCC 27448 TaxID=1240678 RepID=A0A0D7CBR4_9ACTN|nr:hypothetical protein SNA_39235 [Streptomyces natalensis ATCC 27448]